MHLMDEAGHISCSSIPAAQIDDYELADDWPVWSEWVREPERAPRLLASHAKHEN